MRDAAQQAEEERYRLEMVQWEEDIKKAEAQGTLLPEHPHQEQNFTNPDGSIKPDWSQSPIDVSPFSGHGVD